MKEITQFYKNAMTSSYRPKEHIEISFISQNVKYTFYDKDVISAKKVQEADPLSRKLPTETFTFTVSDFSDLYNPASPSGIWETIDENAEISVRFGITFEDTIQWLSEDLYILNGKPIAKGGIVTFSATSRLDTLNGTFYKGVLSIRDLRSLAKTVLEDAGIDSMHYEVSQELSAMTTRSAIPITSHKNALQMIAHAAGCCLRTVNGIITINRIPISESVSLENPTLELSDIEVGGDDIQKVEPIYKVQAKRYYYQTAEEASVLFEEETTVTGHVPFHIEYDEAQNLTATIVTISGSTGTITDTHFYAYAADFTVVGNGTYKITISGKLVKANFSLSDMILGDPGGGTEVIDNQLVTTEPVQTLLMATTGDYLASRISHTLKTRGNPEFEAMDAINFKPTYKSRVSGIVLNNTTTYNGALKGSMVVKSVAESRAALEIPTLQLSNSTLIITGTPNVGEFFKIYVNNEENYRTKIYKGANRMIATFDLTKLGLSPGSYTIKVAAEATYYQGTDKDDATITYVAHDPIIGAPELSLSGSTLGITEGTGSPETGLYYDIYKNTVSAENLVTTVEKDGVTTFVSLNSFSAFQFAGNCDIIVVARAEHYISATSDAITYTTYRISFNYSGVAIANNYSWFIASGETNKVIAKVTIDTTNGFLASSFVCVTSAGTVTAEQVAGTTNQYNIKCSMTSQKGDAIISLTADKGTLTTPSVSVSGDTLSVNADNNSEFFGVYVGTSNVPSKYFDASGNEGYFVSLNLTNCTQDGTGRFIKANASVSADYLTITLSVLTYCALPTSITVTGAQYEYNRTARSIKLYNPTGPVAGNPSGNVTINVTATR